MLLTVAVIPGLLSTVYFTIRVYKKISRSKIFHVLAFYFFSFSLSVFIALSLFLFWGLYPLFTSYGKDSGIMF